MITTVRIVLATTALALAACGSSGPGAAPICPSSPDASEGTVALPTWMLEDVQPVSPRIGQSYGLNTFAGKIIAVTLVEGF